MQDQQSKYTLILDSLQKLLENKNLQSISVSEIAQTAGIGKGSIYYYLDYKTHQRAGDVLSGKEIYAADCNDGTCAATSQSGGSGPDPDDPDA